MCFQIGGVDHNRPLFTMLGRQTSHHLTKDALVAPALPSVVQGLVWPVLLRGITPAQPIAVYEDNATQNTPIIDAWFAMGLREIGLKPRHLRVRQPEKIRHITAPFSEP